MITDHMTTDVIMFTEQRPVNPHPIPGPAKLTQVADRVLRDLIVLTRAGDVPGSRLRLAGIPPLVTLEAERRRREARRLERAS